MIQNTIKNIVKNIKYSDLEILYLYVEVQDFSVKKITISIKYSGKMYYQLTY